MKKQTGKLRVCIDPRDLNKEVKREHYQLPTQDEISAHLAGAKYFSHLDAKSGFWQIPYGYGKLSADNVQHAIWQI